MRRIHATFAVALWAAAAAGPARADDPECAAPMTDWRPRAEVAALAAAKGWSVRRIKVDDGCYEIDGADAGGRSVEASVDPATLAIVEFAYEGGGDGPRADQKEKGHD